MSHGMYFDALVTGTAMLWIAHGIGCERRDSRVNMREFVMAMSSLSAEAPLVRISTHSTSNDRIPYACHWS